MSSVTFCHLLRPQTYKLLYNKIFIHNKNILYWTYLNSFYYCKINFEMKRLDCTHYFKHALCNLC